MMPALPPAAELGLNLGVLIGLLMAFYGLWVLALAGLGWMRPREDRAHLDAALERMGNATAERNAKVQAKPVVDDEVPF